MERSVKEVNDLLGSPPAPQPAPPKPVNQALDVLTVDPKHLNVANEIRKLFGSEEAQPKRWLCVHKYDIFMFLLQYLTI